jgi:hypothetical protein
MTQRDRDDRIRERLLPLVGEPHFEAFIEEIRQQREISIEDACSDPVIANERTHLSAIGEVRCYKNLLAIYDNLVAHRQTQPQEAAED